MDDLQFLDSLQFRAEIRKHWHSLIELSDEDYRRAKTLAGEHLYHGSNVLMTKTDLISLVERARLGLVQRVTDTLVSQ